MHPIQDFHRYDISSSEGVRLAAHCDATYASADAMVHDIRCSSPVGSGVITLHGEAGLPGMHKLSLALNMAGVPMSAVAQLLRRAKKEPAADLVSSGSGARRFRRRMENESSTHWAEFRGHAARLLIFIYGIGEYEGGISLTASIPFVLSNQASV